MSQPKEPTISQGETTVPAVAQSQGKQTKMIEEYLTFFEERLNEIGNLRRYDFKRVLLFCVLEALAKDRYSDVRHPSERFGRLLRNHCGWKDADRVSLVQLAEQLSAGATGISSELKSEIHRRLNEPRVGCGRTLQNDPLFDCMLPHAPTRNDKRFLTCHRHDKLLYACRSHWVHEYREVALGYYDYDEPYYQPVAPDIDDPNPSDDVFRELVHPVTFLVSLVKEALPSLHVYYSTENIDPSSGGKCDVLLQRLFKP